MVDPYVSASALLRAGFEGRQLRLPAGARVYKEKSWDLP